MMESAHADFPELETVCPNCQGKGGWFDPEDGGGAICSECGGGGYIPTALGQRLLKLFEHNFDRIRRELRA
jgi:hypothetical protein